MRVSFLPALLFSLAMAGCAPAVGRASSSAPTVAEAREQWIADRLYFGRGIPGGGTVSEDDWEAFVRDVVTPRFPGGLTVWRTHGQWRESDGTVRAEDTMVVEILHPASAQADAAVEEIARAYKARFRQEAVLRVRMPADARFFE